MTETVNLFREEETGETCPQCGEAKRVKYVPMFMGAEMQIPIPCACERHQAAEKRARDTERGYRLIRDEARRIAGIPGEFCRASLASLSPREGQEAAAAALSDFVRRWRDDRHTSGIMLLGGTGRGKSCFACAAANTVIDEYPIDGHAAWDCGQKGTVCDQHRIVPVRCSRFTETINDMRAEVNACAGDPWRVEERLKSVQLLILDDLGAERLSPYAVEALFRIIDYREREALPVIVTSNLATPKAMKAHFDDRIFSRLNGMCRPVSFTCADQRGVQ